MFVNGRAVVNDGTSRRNAPGVRFTAQAASAHTQFFFFFFFFARPPSDMRNAEVIRQWKILRALDAQRQGKTVDAFALQLNIGKRTIWRDMVALQEAGFPLTSEPDGRRTRWKLVNAPFKGLAELGLSTMDVCALYMARSMVNGMAGAPFGNALTAMPSRSKRRCRRRCGNSSIPAGARRSQGRRGEKAWQQDL